MDCKEFPSLENVGNSFFCILKGNCEKGVRNTKIFICFGNYFELITSKISLICVRGFILITSSMKSITSLPLYF